MCNCCCDESLENKLKEEQPAAANQYTDVGKCSACWCKTLLFRYFWQIVLYDEETK